jgi:peptide/nickel transport system substrate-binding protein
MTRHISKTWLLTLLVVALALGACVSATPSAPSGEPAAPAATEPAAAEAMGGGTITYGMAGNFDKLDPNATTFTRVGRITLHVAEPLVWQKTLGEFEPGLATEWSVNEDATEYTFKLREGVTFHDGTPFNAEAVKFTFDRIVDPETKSQTAFSLIGPYEETEIINDHEIKVKFSSPYAPFLDSLSNPYLAPVSPTAVERVGNEDWGITELVGTGPFMLESFTPESEVVLVRNPDYNWAPEHFNISGPPQVERIVYKIIAEPATRMASLETGETDFIEEVPEIDFKRVQESPDFVTVQEPQPGSGWSLMMNVQNPPTDELAVRRAIQLATDKQGMIETIWNGIGQPACGPLTHVMFGFDPAVCDMYTYDPEEARNVLEEAGWVDTNGDGIRERDGQDLTIGHYYQADSNVSQQMADYMKANLAEVGINVELNGLSRSGYFDAVRAGEHNTQNWWETATDPDVVRVLFYSSNAGGGTNRNNYVNEEMDNLIDQAAAAADPQRRAELYSQIQKKVKDAAIMVFYNDPMTLYAHSNDLSGVIYYLGGNYPYFYDAEISR